MEFIHSKLNLVKFFITDWIKDALKIQDYKQVTKIEVWALTKPTPKGTSALFQPAKYGFS